jgi:hypothetical protein
VGRGALALRSSRRAAARGGAESLGVTGIDRIGNACWAATLAQASFFFGDLYAAARALRKADETAFVAAAFSRACAAARPGSLPDDGGAEFSARSEKLLSVLKFPNNELKRQQDPVEAFMRCVQALSAEASERLDGDGVAVKAAALRVAAALAMSTLHQLESTTRLACATCKEPGSTRAELGQADAVFSHGKDVKLRTLDELTALVGGSDLLFVSADDRAVPLGSRSILDWINSSFRNEFDAVCANKACPSRAAGAATMRATSTRTLSVIAPPATLFFSVQRDDVGRPAHVPARIRFDGLTYEISFVFCRSGANPHAGHYWCFTSRTVGGERRFFKANDKDVTRVDVPVSVHPDVVGYGSAFVYERVIDDGSGAPPMVEVPPPPPPQPPHYDAAAAAAQLPPGVALAATPADAKSIISRAQALVEAVRRHPWYHIALVVSPSVSVRVHDFTTLMKREYMNSGQLDALVYRANMDSLARTGEAHPLVWFLGTFVRLRGAPRAQCAPACAQAVPRARDT